MVDKKIIIKSIVKIFIITLVSYLIVTSLVNYLPDVIVTVLLILIFYYVILSVFKLINKLIINDKTRKIIKLVEVYLFLCFNLIILISYKPFFSSNMFHFKQIGIYFIFAFMITFIAIMIKNNLMKMTKDQVMKTRLIKSFIFGMTCLILFIISQMQILYINSHIIPPLYGCSYYDSANNLIYNSQYAGTCPTLENLKVVNNTDYNELSFTVNEEKYRIVSEDYQERYHISTDIYYKYDLNGNILNHHIRNIETIYIKGNQSKEFKAYQTKSYSKMITNLYQENMITSTHQIKTQSDLSNHSYENESTIEYISKYNEPYITISMKIDGEKKVTYNIDVVKSEYNMFYRIEKEDDDDTLMISYFENDSSIKKTYSTNAFGNTRYLNSTFYSSKTNLITSTNDLNINTINEQAISISRNTIPLIDTIKENTDFGFVLKHYSHEKTKYGYFKKHFNTDNILAFDIKSLGNYDLHALYQNYYPIEFVYQKNPLLFEHKIINY